MGELPILAFKVGVQALEARNLGLEEVDADLIFSLIVKREPMLRFGLVKHRVRVPFLLTYTLDVYWLTLLKL